jgi:hypothetical protein
MDRQEDAQDRSGRWEWKENAEHGESTTVGRSNKMLTVKKIKCQFIKATVYVGSSLTWSHREEKRRALVNVGSVGPFALKIVLGRLLVLFRR